MSEEIDKKKPLISESILIAVIPAIGTFAVYLFQLGYFNFYGIPASFIELDITKIIAASVFIAFFLFFITIVTAFLNDIYSSPHPLRESAGDIFAYCIIMAPFVFFAGGSKRLWAIFFCGLVILSLVIFLRPFLNRSKELSYLQKLEESHKKRYARTTRPIKSGIDLVETRLMPSILAVAILLFTIFFMGGYFAQTLRTYWILSGEETGKKKMILITTYSERFIFIDFDTKTRKIGNEILILKSIDDKPIKLSKMKLGALLPPDDSTQIKPSSPPQKPAAHSPSTTATNPSP